MTQRRPSKIAEDSEEATRRYLDYEERVKSPEPSSDDQLRVLKRDAERAKLALHRNKPEDTDA